MNVNLLKVQVKVKIGKYNSWLHFCYLPYEIGYRFESCFGRITIHGNSFNRWIEKWAGEDFGLDQLKTVDQLETIKHRISLMYKERYPELYIDYEQDKQGWVRVWCKNHMEQEIKSHEQEHQKE